MQLWSLILMLLSSGGVWSGYDAVYPEFYEIGNEFEKNHALRFPDIRGRTGTCDPPLNFVGQINLLESPHAGHLLIGAVDTLYMLNETTMTCQATYSWTTNADYLPLCNNREDGCQNYISLYETFPSDSSRLLICGTQSGVRPQCRTLQLVDQGFSSPTPAFDASNGLISNFPELNGFGEFRRANSSDTTYFSAGFYQLDGSVIGRDYNITFHEIGFDTENLTLTEQFSVKDSLLWLNSPVTFIDYYRGDFGPGYQFYFVFLRENLSQDGQTVIYSRVVRICRNDPGSSGRFTTFIKARILCEREAQDSLEFLGTFDYQYNEITSMVFNDDGGRFAENNEWFRLMYGAFAGPRFGPRGAAICVYRADNTGPQGLNRGIFEVFRGDLITVRPDGTTDEVENNYVMCSDTGRPDRFSNDVLIDQDILQIGDDPILVLDGITITQMALDRVCVSTRNINDFQCKNQDILILGTDSGKILKVVLASIVGTTNVEPVISEEISLDDDSPIDDIKIKDLGQSRNLFVSTDTKVYNIPLERCSRLQGCRNCIAARDPYCVWNNITSQCVSSLGHLSAVNEAVESVSPQIWQNIHVGSVEQCNTVLNCDVMAIAVNHQTIICVVGCNNTRSNSISISTTLPSAIGSNCDRTIPSASVQSCVQFTSNSALGLHSYDCFLPDSSFTESVQTLPGPPVANFEDGIYASCDQTSCEVCVQRIQLTDIYSNYAFKVHYSSGNDNPTLSVMNRLSDGSECITISSLLPSTTVNYIIELQNSVSSLNSSMRSIDLLESFAGPVQNIVVSVVTNVSVELMWNPPAVSNGIISGYSIYVNNTPELGCVSQSTTTRYVIPNLLPFTEYIIRIHACNAAGESNISAEVTTTTLCGTPEAVTNVVVTDITFDGMIFRWNPPLNYNGNIDNAEYQVNIDIYDVNNIDSVQTTVNQNLYHLTRRLPLTLCCAQIWAISTCGGIRLTGYPVSICGQTANAAPGFIPNLMAPENLIGVRTFSLTWEPPRNFNSTPGVTYDIDISGRDIITLVDVTFLSVGNLEPCTAYFIDVSAYTPQTGPSTSVSSVVVTTRPTLPPPPSDISISFDVLQGSPSLLRIMWNPPSQIGCNYNIQLYTVYWRCNQYSNQTIILSPLTRTTNIDISYANLGLGWCVAQIQSCVSIDRCGNFSDQARISTPLLPPTQPTCFIQTESGSNATFSFAITQPFITDDIYITWMLNSTSQSSNGSFSYTISSSNVVTVRVNRNTAYTFKLKICNTYGCSSPCDVDFTTINIPLPPENIVVSEVTATTAEIAWRDSSSGTATISYVISITSSCTTGNMLITEIFTASYSLSNLCPHTNYTIALQAQDMRANKNSPFSGIVAFFTSPGQPSEPRFVNGVINRNRKQLIITWIIPAVLNAAIRKYEIRWTLSTNLCTGDGEDITVGETNNATTYQFIQSSVSAGVTAFSVCVRAITTTGQFGAWGMYINIEGNESGVIGGNIEDCNTLTTVACIAALTVVSSLIMSIILSVSVVQKGWFCSKNKAGEEKKYPNKH